MIGSKIGYSGLNDELTANKLLEWFSVAYKRAEMERRGDNFWKAVDMQEYLSVLKGNSCLKNL